MLRPDLETFGTIVLGCTHFIYYSSLIKQILPDTIEVVDGNKGTVNNMIRIMNENNLFRPDINGGQIIFYSSSEKVIAQKEIQLRNLVLDNM